MRWGILLNVQPCLTRVVEVFKVIAWIELAPLSGGSWRHTPGYVNLDKTLETKTKDRPSAEQALYYFVWLCQEMKEQNRLHAVARHLHIPTHTISGSRPVKGRIDAHTRDISVNETQPLCLSYWTQPWHRQQKPLWNELMSQLDFTGWEKKGRENGTLRRNIFSFRKFASLKQHC